MSGKIRFYLFSLFAVFCTVIFFYFTGCCSKGGGGGVVVNNVGGGIQAEPKLLDVKVNDDGSITKTLAPSGRLTIEAPKKTLNKNVVIHMVENQAMGNESDIYSVGSFIYAIKPDREEKIDDGINIGTNAKREVKMQTNPIILTFSNDERLTGAENYYIGIKEIGSKEWQFVNIYSATNPLINSNGPKGAFEYKLYKDNVYVALFADFNKNLGDRPKVLSMVASMPDNIIEIADGRYNENAVIKLKFIGDNLSSLRADDYRIRLLYANADHQQVDIKIDGKSAKSSGESKNKYEAFGELYAHFYEFIPTMTSYSAGVTPELSFTLNFKKFPVEEFACDFVVEAFNATDKPVPFCLSDSLHFDMKEDKEPEPEPVISTMSVVLSIASDTTNIFDAAKNLYYLNPRFTVTASPSFEFTDEAKAIIASSVTLVEMSTVVRANTASSTEETNPTVLSDEELLTTQWNENGLVIGFRQKLATYTQYVVSMNDLNGLDGVEVTPFEPLTFRTAGTVDVSLATDSTNLIDVENNLYHCRPIFTINVGFNPNDSEKASIASAVTVIGAEKSIVTKTWNGSSLSINFSKNLAADTEYTVSMKEPAGMKRLSLKPFQPLKFKTTGDFYIALSPDVDNVFDTENSLFRCRPSFTITPSTALSDEDQAKIASSVVVTGVDEASIQKIWASGSLTISFTQDIEQNTEFTLSIAELPEIEGKNFITFQPFVFKTIGALELALTPDADNVYATKSPLYHCKPGFTITPSIHLNEEDRAKIASAVSVLNAEDNKITKNWDNEGKLIIGFSQNIAPSTDYTLSMSAVNDIKGVTVVPFANLNFTTVENLGVTLTPNANNVYVAMEPKYRCNPDFIITLSFALTEEDRAKIANAVTINNGASVVKNWEGNNLKISLNQNLATDTAYILSMSAVNDIKGINIVPFDALNFTTVGALSFTVTPDDDNVYAAVSPKYQCRPGFTITPAFTLNDEDKAKIADAIVLSDAGNIATKTWDANSLKVSLTQNLVANTAYTLSMADVNDIDGVTVTPFDAVDFTTIGALTFTVTPDDDNLFDIPNSLTHCKPGFTVTPAFALNDADKAKILDAVTVVDVASSSVVKEWDNEGKLLVSFNTKLASGTDYSLNMAAVDDIKGVTVTSFDPQPFRTMNAINVTLDSEDSNIIDVPNNLYHCRPQFTITVGYEADDDAKAIIASAVTVIGADENNITRNWVNDSLVIGFTSNLTTNTEYTVSMYDIDSSIDRLVFKVFEPLTFTTTGDSYVAIVPDEGNVIVSTPNELYHCRPTFTITPSVALGDSDRATVAGAIHVSNVLDEDLTKNWNASGSLILGFSQNLTHNTQYTVSIDSIGEIAGVNLVLFQPLTFRTVPGLNFVLTADTGNVYEALSTIYRCNPAFTITPNFALSDANKAIIADAVSVSNSAVTVKNWEGNNLRVTFSSNLAPNSTHTISMADVNSITGVTVTSFIPQSFTTVPELSFTLDSPNSNVFVSTPAERYHCRPVFTLTPSFNLNEEDKTIIKNAVTISSDAGLMTKTWNGNVLEIGFSSDLANNTNYTLSMNAVTSISGVTVTGFSNLAFTTMEALTIALTPDAGNIFVSTPELYHGRPAFTVTSRYALNADNKAKIAAAVTLTGTDSAVLTKNWTNDKTLRLTFGSDLGLGSSHTLSMNAVNNITGVTVSGFADKTFSSIGALTFAVASDTGNVYEAMAPLNRCNPAFTISPNYALSALSDANRTALLDAVTVTGSAVTAKEWDGDNIRVTFSSALAPNSNHTLSMSAVDSITGVTVSPFASQNFTTVPALTFTLNSPDSNVFITTPSERYHCRPVFTLTPSFTLNAEDRTIIANAVTISSNANLMTKNWNGNVLEIGFSSDINHDTTFTLSMNAVTSISGVPVTAFTPKTFTTIEGFDINIASDNGNIFVSSPSVLYQCRPTFTVTTNMALNNTDKGKINSAISVSNIAQNKVNKNWSNDTTLNIGFAENLAFNTTYTISMSDVDDISGVSISGFADLSFTTMGALTIALTSDSGNVFVSSPSVLYNCRPAFTVTPSYALNAANKAIIEEAVTVTNSSVTSKNWDGNNLRITFTSDLALNSAHTISMSAVDNITGVTVNGFPSSSFTTMDALTFAVASDSSNVYEAMAPLSRCNPAFTISPNYALSALSAANKTAILNAINVTNSNVTSKVWNNDNIRVTFSQNLEPDTAHTLSMSSVDSITGVTVSPFASQNFTTIPALTFTLNSPDSNVFISTPAERYHCRPVFTLTPSFNLNDEDKTIIKNAVTISSNANLMTKTWNDNVLEIGFSSDLANNTNYTLSMNAVTSISGVSVTPVTPKSFTTIEGLVISIASDSGDVFAIENGVGLYQTLPTFTVTSNMALSDADQEKIKAVISVSNIDPGKVTKNWANSTTLNISFTENLTHDTDYTISMGEVDDISGVTVTGFDDLDFRTMKPLTIALTPDAGNIFISTPELYHGRPAFTVTSKYALNADDKAKIAGAITLTGTDSAVLTKNWTDDKTLRLTFGSDLGLGSSHTLSMDAVTNITGVTVSCFADKTFNSIGALTFAVASDSGNVYEAMAPLSRCNPAFTISPNYALTALSDADRTALLNAVSVTGSAVTSKVWDVDNIRVTFSSNLAPDSAYALNMADVNSITGVTVTPFASQNFTTVPALTFTLDSPDSNVFITTPLERYHCRPVFTLTPSFNLNAEDKTIIKNAVTISSNANLMTKTWNDNVLEIGFSDDLPENTEFTLSMNAVSTISGVTVTPFTAKTFTTVGALVVSIASDSGDVFAIENGVGLYQTLPAFTVTSNMALSDADQEKIKAAISVSNIDPGKVTKNWVNSTTLNISFTENLTHDTDYTISMGAVSNISGVTVTGFSNLAFTTMEALTITLTPDAGNIFVSTPELYHGRPAFTVTSRYALNADNKAKIAAAVTLTGTDSAVLTKNWTNDKTLRLTFGSDLGLGSSHTISMNAVNNITGVTVSGFADKTFSSIGALTFAVASDTGNVYEAMAPLNRCNPAFTISPNYALTALSDSDRTALLNAVSVTDSAVTSKVWDGDNIRVTFSSNLEPDTAHTLSMSSVDSITGVTVSPFASQNFTTVPALTFTLNSPASNVFVSAPAERYHCRPVFTLTPAFTLNAEDRTKIANAVTISSNANLMTKTWNDNVLEIGFSDDLPENTEFTLSMNAVSSISGVTVTPFTAKTFTTVGALVVSIASDSGDVFAIENGVGLYQTLPTFTVTSNMPLGDTDKAKIEAAISVSNVDDSNIRMSWSNASTLNISFAQNLANDTAYTISMAAVNNINGVSVNGFANLPFRTMEPLTFTATPDLSNVYTAMTPKYHCRPAFTISPNYSLSALSEASKTALLNAVTISNSSGLTKAWNNDNIRLTFSSNLTPNSSHTLSMAAVDFTGITVNTFANLDFTVLDTLTFAIATGSTDVYEAMSPKYRLNPTFTITPSFTLNAADKTNIENSVSVTNSNITSKAWDNNNLVITFSQNLTPNRTYTLAMGNVSGMDNISLTKFSDLAFTTLPILSFALTKDDDNVFYDGKYHCRPGFTVTPGFTLSADDKTLIENAITLSNVSDSIITKTWNDNVLTLGLNQNIATSTSYTLSMSAINITGVSASPFSSFSFTTIPDLIVGIATTPASLVKKTTSSTEALEVNGKNYIYCSDSDFIISTNISLNDEAKEKIKNAIYADGVAAGLLTISNFSWFYGTYGFKLGFSSTFAASSTARILMSEITDIKGVTVKTFSPYEITTFFHQGHGTENDPFTIYTPAQLACLDLYPGQSYYYRQMEDLDLSGYANWDPIGSYTSSFNGYYNGNYKKISNVEINRPDENYVGLFAQHSSSSIINDLTLENINVKGNSCCGILVGGSFSSSSLLNNITIVNSSVSGDNRVGGVTGYSSGSTITNVNVSNVIASSPGSVGGIIGDTYQSTLTNLEGDHIEVIGDYTVGIALASLSNQSRLENCRITNSTASGTGSWIGGCVGYLQTAEAIDVHCEDVRVNGRGEVGGCFGRVERNATVSEVHCENVFVESSSYSTGGCSGLIQENSNISNITCNNVTVNGTNYVGCAIGKINNSQLSICNITDSTATGTKEVGGCAGYVANNSTFNDITCEHLIVKATGDRSGGFVGSTETNCSFTDITCDDVNVEGNGYVGCAFGTISNGTLTTCNITDSMASSTSWQAGGCAGQANGGSNLSGVVCQNLQINAGGDYAGGCIGQTFGNCEFSDILCDNVSVECAAGKQGLGGLMGYCIHSTKDNCRVINSRVGNGSSNGVCGGLVGELGHYYADTSTNNCFVRNTDILSTSYCIGGLFGSANNAGDISNCFVDDCRITGSDRSGGFSGQFGGDNRLNSCYVASISLDTTGDYIGGFVGRSESSITSCYTERVKILAKSHSVGGLVGYQTVDGVIELSHATRAKIEVDDRTQNRQCYGGLVGQSSGTISLSYVDDSDIDSFQNVGGLVGYCPGGSVSKCFVKDTRVKGYNLVIGGLAAQVSLEAQVDSCYVKNCNVSCTVEMNALDHGISGLVASNSGDITNCYTYNTTVTGKSGYGALVGINGNAGEATTIANCFIRENYSTLIDYNQNSTPLTSCYYNVGDLAAFKAQTWSDGKTIEGGSTAWSNFNRTSFPPQLTELPEP